MSDYTSYDTPFSFMTPVFWWKIYISLTLLIYVFQGKILVSPVIPLLCYHIWKIHSYTFLILINVLMKSLMFLLNTPIFLWKIPIFLICYPCILINSSISYMLLLYFDKENLIFSCIKWSRCIFLYYSCILWKNVLLIFSSTKGLWPLHFFLYELSKKRERTFFLCLA